MLDREFDRSGAPMDFTLHPTLAADTEWLVDLPLARALLMRDANYPWVILVPRRVALRELTDLNDPDMAQLTAEIRRVSAALTSLYAPCKLNVAALGNQVEQLHIHVIARQKSDAAWPKPVWGAAPPRPYDAEALAHALAALRQHLGA
jgi:diadenosine tetraphosphate (Ap4A) HIT family hydrolase